jgi:tetratricopeptide (TPR) repeat protein
VQRLTQFGLFAALVLFLTSPCLVGQTVAPPQQKRAEAIAFEQRGQLADAESAWRDVLKARPADAEAYAHLAFLAAHQERYKEAIPLYRKALAINPNLPGMRLNLGLSLFKNGDLKEAILTFAPLQKSVPPNSPDALRITALIGMAHYGLAEYPAAIPFLKKAAKSDPANLGFRMALAQSCLYAKQYPCVLDAYREILDLNAESAEADMLAAEALDAMQNYAGAIEQFRAAIKADPAFPNAHFGLGYLLWTQTKFDQAAAEFKAELNIVPDNAQALAFLADCLIHLGKEAEALPLAERAVQIDRNIDRAHVDLAILYTNSGRRDEAVREFKEAIRLSPNVSDTHWRLARLYQSMGKKEEAKAEFAITSTLQKEEKAAIAAKLKAAQDKGKPADAPSDPPAPK